MNRYVGCVAILLLSACSGENTQETKTAPAAMKSVRVRWTKSTDPDVAGYRIYRGDRADFPLAGAPFLEAGPNATAVVFPDLPSGRHFFKVVAKGTLAPVNGKGGESAPVLVEAKVP